ncbi:MAG: 50S ribosomal protein L4 [Candidatus Omnitrophica bacterium]|nr:50S ribosomal protein L4 [Candidatus Omnitrophota bacterium]
MATSKLKESQILPVLDADGKRVGKLSLDPQVFDGKTNRNAIHQVWVSSQANQRQGNASTKHRGEVSGGGVKPWRQKGTGRARHGSSRSPIWRGGGTVWGPRPRDYSQKVPRKLGRAVLRWVLNEKLLAEEIVIIKEWSTPEQPKTKAMVSQLEAFGVLKDRPLLVTDEVAPLIYKSARNLRGVGVVSIDQIGVRDLLTHGKLVITENAFGKLVERVQVSS